MVAAMVSTIQNIWSLLGQLYSPVQMTVVNPGAPALSPSEEQHLIQSSWAPHPHHL